MDFWLHIPRVGSKDIHSYNFTERIKLTNPRCGHCNDNISPVMFQIFNTPDLWTGDIQITVSRSYYSLYLLPLYFINRSHSLHIDHKISGLHSYLEMHAMSMYLILNLVILYIAHVNYDIMCWAIISSENYEL